MTAEDLGPCVVCDNKILGKYQLMYAGPVFEGDPVGAMCHDCWTIFVTPHADVFNVLDFKLTNPTWQTD